MEKFDISFEKKRLKLLQDQCLSDDRFNGEIVFGCLPKSNRNDFATWFFEDREMTIFHENGFRTFIQALIEILAEYRQVYGIKPNKDCCIKVVGSELTIEWLADNSAEKLIDNKRNVNAYQ